MRKRVKQLIALSLEEWCLLLTAMLLLPVIALMLWLFGFRRSQTFMNYFISAESRSLNSDKLEKEKAHVIARMVSIAARYGVYRANCLEQSLLLWWLLASDHIQSRIRFGIRQAQSTAFAAHAWVEYHGETLSDSHEFHHQHLVFE